MSACVAFAEAITSGETKDFLAKLDPAVEYISKWKSLSGAGVVSDFLNENYFTEREGKQTAFVGAIVSSKRMPPCVYSLDTIHQPRLVLTFSLSDEGMIQGIYDYPAHYLRHRDGKLSDVLSD